MAGSHPLLPLGSDDRSQDSGGLHVPEFAGEERKLIAFTEQWTRHQGSVQAYLASFLGNTIEVDDALQEVAVVVWQKGPWDGEASDFLAYSLACARRIALAARRKMGDPRLQLLSPEVTASLADRVASLELLEEVPSGGRVLALRKCLKKIKPEQRALLESRYSGGSKDELRAFAKRGGKSMDALYKTLERLRDLLRACIERAHHPTE